MKISNLLIALCLILTSCNNTSKVSNETKPTEKTTEIIDSNTPKVTGIGGVFFASDDPSTMQNWYSDNLGIALDPYGSVFEFRNGNNPDEINYLRWSLFKKDSEYLKPSKKEFMVNYRVQNLEGLVDQLKQNGISILDTIAIYEYGKFAHIMDPEGNKIELWEPVDSFLTSLGGPTNK